MSSTQEFSKRWDQLSETKRGLLQKWKRGELHLDPHVQTIPRRSTPGPIPLSFAQQRLWFLDQLIPNSPVYNLSSALMLVGSLNLIAFRQSVNEIVQRHEILRTTFPTLDGKPSQIVTQFLSLYMPIADLSVLSEAEREATAWRLVREEARQPFDLAQGPLIRIALLRLSEDRHIFLLILHHTICDGWSLGIFLKELGTIYEASLRGMPSPLPELPIQYADFAVWQRERLPEEVLQTHLTYWKQQFDGASTVLHLPTDRPRPPVQTHRGDSLRFTLSQALSQALKVLSQREQVTLFTTLLAAFKALLYRYSKQEDIIVGTPIANRQRVELENLIGFFANTLVLRTTLSGHSCFRELLGQVHRTMLAASAHQDLPFEYLVEALHLERDMSYNPLFQVMFNFDNVPRLQVELPELKLSNVLISAGTAMFDLWLSMGEDKDGLLRGTLEYNSDLFDAASIQGLLQHFQVLLQAIVTDPGQPLADLPLLTASERDQMLLAWNSTQRPYPLEQPLAALLQAQIECTPEAIAVQFADEQLSYQELHQRANQLAHALQSRGVGPDVLVGVYMERSLELVIGLLAILKAGGAYVPLEPSYPQPRLAFLLQDTQVRVLLTQQKLKDKLPEQRAQVLCLDSDWPQLAQQRSSTPSSPVQPDHLAYVIYTSGSTGQPKGAMNRQRSIVNRLLWMQRVYHLQPEDRVLHKTPISFDVSVWELFWPLLCGACLVLAQPEGHRDSRYLVEVIREQQITTLHFVPSLLHVLLEERELPRCSSLRRVICSGEALDGQTQQQWYARMSVALYNLYGPTEAAVDVTWWACEPESSKTVVPIGRPIANTQIYLLDERLQPVPVGVAGELYIGGVSLARGYWKQAALTAERFLPNPWSQQPGERLYKTGDLARYRVDGTIEFVGRMDSQVKLHGVRIELGEIESWLRQHPDVQDAVVVVRQAGSADKRLVAYVVLRADGHDLQESPATPAVQLQQLNQHIAVLREYLKGILPEYMIPAFILPVEALPLTTSGKIDRLALPEPDLLRSASPTTFLPPCTPVEERLAALWKEVLGLEQISMNENFFEVGGDSIRSIQIVSRAAATGLRLSPRLLFQHQTIAELATVVEVAAPTVNKSTLRNLQPPQSQENRVSNPPLVQVDWQNLGQLLQVNPEQIEDAYPLSPMQQTMLFQRRHTGDPGLYWLCAMSSMGKARINLPAFAQAWQLAVDQHPVMRTVFVWEDLDEPLQVVLKRATLQVEHHDWRGLAPSEQEEAAELYLQALLRRGIQLSRAPQIHMAIAQVGDEDYYQFFGFNYMLLDGWSSTLRGRDSIAFYEALCRGQKPHLEPPRAYRDYIAWLQQQDLAKAEAFWRKTLKDLTLSMPLVGQPSLDKPRAGDPFVKEILPLSAGTTTALQSLARKQQLTLATLLNAAWALIVSLASGQEDVVFGHLCSGRPPSLAGSEYMVGFFNNILPLRVQVLPEVHMLPWLKQLQGRMIELREYEYSPLMQIKEWIGLPAAAPLFESYVVFENFPVYSYKGVGSKAREDFGIRASDDRRAFVPTEYPLRIEFWPFQQLTMMVSGYQRYCSPDLASQLLQQLKTVLEAMVANPTQRLRELIQVVLKKS